MKKIAVTLIILTIAISFAGALDKYGFYIGVNLSYNNDSVTEEVVDSGIISLDDIAIGLELRNNISNLLLDISGDLAVLDTERLYMSGIFSAGLTTDLFDLFRFSITTGPKIAYVYSGRMQSVDRQGRITNMKNFIDAFKDGLYSIRIMLDVIAGPVMTAGFACTIPTEYSINNGDLHNLVPHWEDFDKAQISFCVQMQMF